MWEALITVAIFAAFAAGAVALSTGISRSRAGHDARVTRERVLAEASREAAANELRRGSVGSGYLH